MISRIVARLNWYKRLLLAKLGIKRKYKIGNTYIFLDYTHRLPDYQLAHPNYDRFLPHIATYLPSESVVIDVGANVGDTLAGMVGKKADLEYVCIEADKYFYDCLLKNIRRIMKQSPGSKIHAINRLVGKNIGNVSLVGEWGTKRATLGGEIKSERLSRVLEKIGVKNRISLIKSDVDGYDYDVIRSAYDLLGSNPFLYFECQCDNYDQLSGYKEVFSEIEEKGFNNFSLFDNFGQFFCTTKSLSEIDQLLDYVYRQNHGKGTRTLFYYDVLAYHDEAHAQVDSIISAYIK